jgi:tRNA-dependent cyclodipeptide synthase
MGISLDNPVFGGRYLAAMLAWATEMFDSCLIVVGDYLRRHNEQILNGLAPDAAAEAAIAAGDRFLETTASLFDLYSRQKVQVIRWRECLDYKEYAESRAMLDELFATDERFRESLRKDALSFVDRQNQRNRDLAAAEQEAVDVSCRYLLEEIAVFSALSEQGRKVELYPGPELEVLVDIAEGKFENIPRGLKERINVELRCNKYGASGR